MTAYISSMAYPETKMRLGDMGYSVTELNEGDKPYPAVSSHPDMYMCRTKRGILRAESGENRHYLAYNCVFLDKYLIHNLKFTSPRVLREAENEALELINVRQGYTKCSCAVIDGRSVITADRGIISALRGRDSDVLTVSPGHVLLDGFDYGFIGGTCGRAGEWMIFNGDLSFHPDGERIRDFIRARGLGIFEVPGKPLYDIGTVITSR